MSPEPRKFYKRSERLRAQFLELAKTRPSSEFKASYSSKFVVIALLDCWSDFNRSVVLRSAVGGVHSTGGITYPSGRLPNERAALLAAKTNSLGKVCGEPRWHDANQSIATAKKLHIANYRSFSSAIGAATSPADEIRLVRNYFAHEKSDCADKLRSAKWFTKTMDLSPLGVSAWMRPDGRLSFEFWVDELQAIAGASVA